MKNVTCRKLSIDRSKSPEKLGTLKDISLYGSYQFQSCGGLVARSLAGVGKELKKTKQQLQALSNRTRPIAGSTGATTNEDILSSCSSTSCNQSSNYSVNFIQHATSPQQPATDCFKPVNAQVQQLIPKCGYALKSGSAKRTVFTQEQKEVMIEFYNRQAHYGIRADTAECAAAMRERGLEPLKESQIKSWWSSYHQKRKREMERMAADLQTASEGIPSTSSNQPASTTQPTRSVPAVSASLPTQPAATVSGAPAEIPSELPATVATQSVTISSQPTSSVSSASARTPSQPTASISMISTAGASQTTASVSVALGTISNQPIASVSLASTGIQIQPTASVATAAAVSFTCQPTVCVPAPSPRNHLIGTDADHGITEWLFQRDISQSTLDGRNGSNACVFIALSFASIYRDCQLPNIKGHHLETDWQEALKEAIRMGNSMHDELFDRQGVNVALEDAIAAVGDLCQVCGIAQEFNVFGAHPLQQLENVVHSILHQKSSFHIIVVNLMAMLMIVDSDGQLILVDSHMHGSKGALIARSIPFQVFHARWFSLWFDRMLISTCGAGLSVCSVSTISFP